MDKDDYSAPPASAGTAPDAPRTHPVRSLVAAWSRLSGQLVPLIGESGFGALFGRTLRLVGPAHAWLSVDPARKTSASLLAALEHDMAAVDCAAANAVNDELMSTFTRQLAALIGAGLTARLLANAHQGAIATTGEAQQQNQQEHK